jgi:hypothetical protein
MESSNWHAMNLRTGIMNVFNKRESPRRSRRVAPRFPHFLSFTMPWVPYPLRSKGWDRFGSDLDRPSGLLMSSLERCSNTIALDTLLAHVFRDRDAYSVALDMLAFAKDVKIVIPPPESTSRRILP